MSLQTWLPLNGTLKSKGEYNSNVLNSHIVRLPNEYQEVEYIESTGTQYINTNLTFSSDNVRIKSKSVATQIDGNYSTYRMAGASDGTDKSCILYYCSNTIYLGLGRNDYSQNVSYSLNTVLEADFSCNNGIVSGTFNGQHVSNSYSGTISISNPLYLFASNERGTASNYSSVKLYSLQCWSNNILVRNFVPCYQKSNNKIGLYDLVNNVFYENSGTGTFNKGQDILPINFSDAGGIAGKSFILSGDNTISFNYPNREFEISFSMFGYMLTPTSTTGVIFNSINSDQKGYKIYLKNTSGNYYLGFACGAPEFDSNVQIPSGSDIFPCHIAITSNSLETKFYLNGELSQTTTNVVSNNYDQIFTATLGSDSISGYLSDFRIYNHCLSAKEVEEVSKGLCLHYKLDDIQSSLIYDVSGYDHHGTVTDGVSLSSDTSRYENSTYVSSGYIKIPELPKVCGGSISMWVKEPSIGNELIKHFAGDTTTKYLLATKDGTGNFTNSNASYVAPVKYYFDGVEATAPSGLSSGWHQLAMTGLSFQPLSSATSANTWTEGYVRTKNENRWPQTYNMLTDVIPDEFITGDIIICPYSGEIKELTLEPGTYQLECWGAKGSSYTTTSAVGGNGGYTVGTYAPSSSTTLYLVSGGRPYNGGGLGESATDQPILYGGGATHIATQTGLLSTLSASTSSIIAVAGGGGGASGTGTDEEYKDGGLGGGTTGGDGSGSSSYIGHGGTQTEGGEGYTKKNKGSFGQGGQSYYASYYSGGERRSGGGGGGYYGGGGGSFKTPSLISLSVAGGGGGSGYISSVLTNASTTQESTSTNPDAEQNGYIKITVLFSSTPATINYPAYWSDLRIYGKELSASQIKELYDTSATMDHSGNLFVREFKEDK